MKTAVVTDGKYRASLAAVRALGAAGFRVVVTQTKGEAAAAPASFLSRYAAETRWIDGSCKDDTYGQNLLALLGEYDTPVLFCTGADTLNLVSRRREEFAAVARFLVAPPQVLDDRYPVVIKPHCGEKVGLKARERYVIAENTADYMAKYSAMARYDADPIVQEKVVGPGEGVNLLLDEQSRLICAFCHRRLREYPASGGPSTCCVSFYDAGMIDQAYRLLASFGFVGMAMVEFKGGKILEVNPRVWGSFPLSVCCGSPFTALYANAALGGSVDYTPQDFRAGVKMRYLFNDGMAVFDYLRHGKLRPALAGIADFFGTREALDQADDKAAYRAYLRDTLRRHGQ